MIVGEDADIQRQGEGDRWPVARIARNTAPRDGFQVVVDVLRHDFDCVVVDHRLDISVNQDRLGGGQSALFGHEPQSPL